MTTSKRKYSVLKSLLFGIIGLLCLTTSVVHGAIVVDGGNQQTVTTTYVTLTGSMTAGTGRGFWYEVYPGNTTDGVLSDFGARKADSSWSITVRHLKFGDNLVVIKARNGSDNLETVNVILTLEETNPPTVRPRPIPTEIWWGGLSDNSQLLNQPWDFVKKYQDGYFVHSSHSWGDLSNTERVNLATMLKPYNTRYMKETGDSFTTDASWPNKHTSLTSASKWQNAYANEPRGWFFTETMHDFEGDGACKTKQANPTWTEKDCNAFFTGDLAGADNPDVVGPKMGGWGKVFDLLYSGSQPRFEYAKMGQTWTPVVYNWNGYAALSSDSLFFEYELDGVTKKARYDAYDVQKGMLNALQAKGLKHFSWGSDAPWPSTSSWDNDRSKIKIREKCIAYEAYLQSRGGKHYRICNNNLKSPSLRDRPDDWDNQYKEDSLKTMYIHQNDGGRANKYIFESWFGSNGDPYVGRPYTCAPESKEGSFSNLAMHGIKYIKGIKNLAGDLEELDLILTDEGSRYKIELKNLGDIACMPAILALHNGVGVSASYEDADGNDITAKITSPEGYTFARDYGPDTEDTENVDNVLFQPNETVTIGYLTVTSLTSGQIALEAFWNPQDPTGIIRDREVIGDRPFSSHIGDQVIPVDTSTGPIEFTVSAYDTDLDALILNATSSDTVLLPNGNIVLEGSGANRTITLTPATGQTGTATVSLTVSDGTAGSTNTFDLVVLPPPELIAHWPLDEGAGTSASDVSGNGHDGVIENGATWGSDETRESYVSFDGTNDHINTDAVFDATAADKNFTWVFWANSQSAASATEQKNSVLVGNRYPDYGGELHFMKQTPTQQEVRVGGANQGFDYADLPENEWHHHAVVKSGTTLTYYLDGEQVASGAMTTFAPAALPFFIGGDPNTGSANEHFHGFIDDVYLFASALAPIEIQALKGVPPPPPSDMVAHWPMDEGTGFVATDASGNGYDGTLANGPTWGSDATRASYVSFDGTDDRIETAFQTDFTPAAGDFTCAVWVNSQSAPNDGVIIGNRRPDLNSQLNFWKLTTKKVNYAGSGTQQSIDFADMTQDGWHHHAVVKSGATMLYYRDGVFVDSREITAFAEGLYPFYMGGDPAGNAGEHFHGFIDDVVLYSSALSVERVVDVMNGIYGSGAAIPPLLDMEAANGELAFSWSGNGFKVQTKTNLVGGTWLDYPGGTASPVTVMPTNPAAFFRLIEQ